MIKKKKKKLVLLDSFCTWAVREGAHSSRLSQIEWIRVAIREKADRDGIRRDYGKGEE